MPVLSLNCQNCGANLDIPGEARFVKCNYCNSSLEVKSAGGVTFTVIKEKLDQIAKKTDHLEQQVDSLQTQRKLDELDRSWEARRKQLMIRNKQGLYVPKVYHAYLSGAILIVAGLSLFYVTYQLVATSSANEFLPLFGGLLVVLGILSSIYLYHKARRYEQEYVVYKTRRRELLSKL